MDHTPAPTSAAPATPTSSILSHGPKPTTAACARRPPSVKAAFARDLLYLTLAPSEWNRYEIETVLCECVFGEAEYVKHSTDNEHGSPVIMPDQESRFCEPSFGRPAKGRKFVRG